MSSRGREPQAITTRARAAGDRTLSLGESANRGYRALEGREPAQRATELYPPGESANRGRVREAENRKPSRREPAQRATELYPPVSPRTRGYRALKITRARAAGDRTLSPRGDREPGEPHPKNHESPRSGRQNSIPR